MTFVTERSDTRHKLPNNPKILLILAFLLILIISSRLGGGYFYRFKITNYYGHK